MFQQLAELSYLKSVTWTSPRSYSSTLKAVCTLKRETKQSALKKAKADMINANAPSKSLYLLIAFYNASYSLYLRASRKEMAIRRPKDKSITLAQLLFLITRLRLILLTSSTRSKINTLLHLHIRSETTNLDSLPLIHSHYTRIKGRSQRKRSH